MALMCTRIPSIVARFSRPLASFTSPVLQINNALLSAPTSHNQITFPSTPRSLSTSSQLLADDKVNVTIEYEKETVTLPGKIGDSILDVIVDNDYEILGYGACEGTIACSTCHCIIEADRYKDHSKGITEEEIDLLEMISHVRTDTSRLGCQVYLSDKSEGLRVKVPPPTDIRED